MYMCGENQINLNYIFVGKTEILVNMSIPKVKGVMLVQNLG